MRKGVKNNIIKSNYIIDGMFSGVKHGEGVGKLKDDVALVESSALIGNRTRGETLEGFHVTITPLTLPYIHI